MTGRIVRADFRNVRSVEGFIASIMAEARRQTGMTEGQFASELDRRLARHPGFTDGAVVAWEAGEAVPAADVLGHALAAAGIDLRELLAQWFSRHPTLEAVAPQPSSGLPG